MRQRLHQHVQGAVHIMLNHIGLLRIILYYIILYYILYYYIESGCASVCITTCVHILHCKACIYYITILLYYDRYNIISYIILYYII